MSDFKNRIPDHGWKSLRDCIAESLPCPPQDDLDQLRKALDKIGKEIQKMDTFLGIFKCSIQDGRICVPWTLDRLNNRFVWQRIACDDTDTLKLILTYEEHPEEPDDYDRCVLEQGVCEFSENGDWILPRAALEFLNTDECVWIGGFIFAELMTVEKYDTLYDEQYAEDINKMIFDELGTLNCGK